MPTKDVALPIPHAYSELLSFVDSDRARLALITAQDLVSTILDDEFAALRVSIVFKDAKRYKEAALICSQILRNNPTNGLAQYERAIVLCRLGIFEEPLDLARRLVTSEPASSRYRLLLAIMESSEGIDPVGATLADLKLSDPDELTSARYDLSFAQYLRRFPRSQTLIRLQQDAGRFRAASEIGHRLLSAVRESRPYALVRAGDGEGAWAFMSSEEESGFAPLFRANRQNFLSDWFGTDSLIDAPHFHTFAQENLEITLQADVIGVPAIEWVRHEYGLLSGRGVPSSLNILRQVGFLDAPRPRPPALLCSSHTPTDLHNAGFFKELFTENVRFGVITSFPALPDYLRRRGADVAFHYLVPGDSRNFWTGKQGHPACQYPDYVRDIIGALSSQDLRNVVVLVAAGFVGKRYCLEIRKRGGIAIDIGALANQWGQSKECVDSTPPISPKEVHESKLMRNEVPTTYMLDAIVAGILDSGTTVAFDGSFVEELGPHVSDNDTISLSVQDLLRQAHPSGKGELLDFGCGTADHRAMIEGLGYRWQGVNYSAGMATGAAVQAQANPDITFYDGQHLPYADATFDVVYSFQTFEHVRHIETVFSEISRVLKPGGALVGAVSYLEQMHDYSTFNFTPYGFKVACQQGRLDLGRVYPRFDVLTWMLRRLLIVTSASDENSLNRSLNENNSIFRNLEKYAKAKGLSIRNTNLLKLLFCSHYTFIARRPQI